MAGARCPTFARRDRNCCAVSGAPACARTTDDRSHQRINGNNRYRGNQTPCRTPARCNSRNRKVQTSAQGINAPIAEESLKSIRDLEKHFNVVVNREASVAESLKLAPGIVRELFEMDWWLCDARPPVVQALQEQYLGSAIVPRRRAGAERFDRPQRSPQDAASVTILAIGYRARCTAPEVREPCPGDPALLIAGGQPIANLAAMQPLCEAIERDYKARLTVYNDCEPPSAPPGRLSRVACCEKEVREWDDSGSEQRGRRKH
jgi:hypothetical protein